MKEAIVYHSADPIRLTEHHFKIHHKQHGHSRVLINDKGIGRIFFDSGHAIAQFAIYSLARTKETDTEAKAVFITISEWSKPNSRTGTARDAVALWWPILP